MSDSFDLDLRSVEEHLELPEDVSSDRIVLGVLDGTTPDEEWIDEIQQGHVLVLSVDGDLNQLASGWAKDVKEAGATLMHFRRFLVVTPPGVEIDTDRL